MAVFGNRGKAKAHEIDNKQGEVLRISQRLFVEFLAATQLL